MFVVKIVLVCLLVLAAAQDDDDSLSQAMGHRDTTEDEEGASDLLNSDPGPRISHVGVVSAVLNKTEAKREISKPKNWTQPKMMPPDWSESKRKLKASLMNPMRANGTTRRPIVRVTTRVKVFRQLVNETKRKNLYAIDDDDDDDHTKKRPAHDIAKRISLNEDIAFNGVILSLPSLTPLAVVCLSLFLLNSG